MKPQTFIYNTETVTVTRADGGYRIETLATVTPEVRNALMFLVATGTNTLMADGVFITRVRERAPLVNKEK